MGMKFDVLDPKGRGNQRPRDRRSSRFIVETKVRVKVKIVQERLSVAGTYRTREVNIGGTGGALGKSLAALRDASSATICKESRNIQNH